MCYPRKSTPCASLLTPVATNIYFFVYSLPYIILNSAPVIWNHKFLTNCFRLENICTQIICYVSQSVASYALDNTLHAICYHHVENQRGSLVKEHGLFTRDFACSIRRQYYR
uniref:SFRICE_040378 n=1 Tax=Spodoptera frugiperda TaxID=7108 RepID=A0A2H1WQG2_SPOFR